MGKYFFLKENTKTVFKCFGKTFDTFRQKFLPSQAFDLVNKLNPIQFHFNRIIVEKSKKKKKIQDNFLRAID